MNVDTVSIVAIVALALISGYITYRQLIRAGKKGCDACSGGSCDACHIYRIKKLQDESRRKHGS